MGNTALMKASEWGLSDVVKIIVDAGADKDAKDEVSYLICCE